MKHWHRCDRWIRRRIPCPFIGVGEHDVGDGGPDRDDLPFFPFPVAPPPLPLFVAAKKAFDVVKPQRPKEDVVTDIAIFEKELKEIQTRAFPIPPTREDFGIKDPPERVKTVLKQMDRALEEIPTEDPPARVKERLHETANVDEDQPPQTQAPRKPSEGKSVRIQVAEEAAARQTELIREVGLDDDLQPDTRSGAQPMEAIDLRGVKSKPFTPRGGTKTSPVGVTKPPAPRGGGGGGFTMKSIVDQILGKGVGRRKFGVPLGPTRL